MFRFIRNTAIDLCLGCRHPRVTRPFTIADDTYQVCLECGHKLAYSAEGMRPLSRREQRRQKATRVAAAPKIALVPAGRAVDLTEDGHRAA